MEIIKTLIIEDNKDFTEVLNTVLKDYENIEIVASSGNIGDLSELILKYQPQMILIDVDMHEFDGSRTVNLIKEKFPGLYIILMNMDGRSLASPILKSYYADDYIDKTMLYEEMEILSRRLKNMFGKPLMPNMSR